MLGDPVHFPGATGATLSGRLHLPDGEVRGGALFAHCFTCGKDIRAARRIAHALSQSGLAVLRFDFTGLGESEGAFADTNFSSNVDDLVAAAAFLEARSVAPALLVGHSLGGTAVLAAAHRLPACRAVVTIAAPASPRHLEHVLGPHEDLIRREGEAPVNIAGRTFCVREQLLDDLSAQELEPLIRDLGRPLLVLHSPRDTVVPVDQAARIFGLARHPRSFLSLDNADHLLSRPADAEWAAAIIAAWARPYTL